MLRMTYPDPPIADFRFIVKQSLTKKSRRELAQRMVQMSQLTGWRDTTLNPDMGTATKMAILTNRYGKIVTAEDDPAELYDELIALSAVTMGWAQSIARRQKKNKGKDKGKDKG
jgi:hypothetical protein